MEHGAKARKGEWRLEKGNGRRGKENVGNPINLAD
jgi:hypothetical protein